MCLLFCNDEGTVNDLWQYQRGTETESVTARGWLVSNYREVTLNARLSGEGVGQISDLMITTYLRSGQLVPVLLDWEMRDAPPVNLLYPSNQRRNPRARIFIDFVNEVFRDLQTQSDYGPQQRPAAERPYWHRRQYRRASTAIRRHE